MLDICLLGTGGMMPMPGRFLTSLAARLNGRMMLIDCGEGTQVTMKMQGWGFKNIDAICFTHFHADHISGLPGLLLTIGNAGRTEPLKLVGPQGLTYIVEGLRRIAPELPFPLELIELGKDTPNPLRLGEFEVSFCQADHMVRCYAYRIDVKRRGKFDPKKAEALGLPRPLWGKLQKEGAVEFEVSFCQADHMVRCYAYRIDVKRRGKFDPKKAEALGLPRPLWGKLQKEGAVEFEGKTYTPDMVLGAERPGIAMAYCTDSRPVDRLAHFAKGVQLFICEGMYGEEEKKPKALEHKHMLFSEAARLAKFAEAEELWLTHFSPALQEPAEFLQNATDIFPNTLLGEERKMTTLYFPKEG